MLNEFCSWLTRIELEEQAQKSFNNILKSDYTCVIWKENKDDWMKADIVGFDNSIIHG